MSRAHGCAGATYLNGLDQFVKHELKCRYYLRYCDDFLLLSRDYSQLLEWWARIERFLSDRLELELNPRWRLAPVANGINFLGYIVRRDYKLVRRRVVGNLHEKLRGYESQLVRVRMGVCCYRFDGEVLEALSATLASYLGHFKMADSYNLRRSIWERYPFLENYFGWDEALWKLEHKYKAPKGFRRVRDQYAYFRWRFPHDVLLFQVGRFYEFYHPRDVTVALVLGLSPMRGNRRRALYGFPVVSAGRCIQALLRQRMGVVVIGERERCWTRIKERLPVLRYEGGCEVLG